MALKVGNNNNFDPNAKSNWDFNANISSLPYEELEGLTDVVTYEPLKNSVVDICGHTISKTSVEKLRNKYIKDFKEEKENTHIKEEDIPKGYKCPLSRQFVPLDQLRPNLALDQTHDEMKKIFHKKMSEVEEDKAFYRQKTKEMANSHPDLAVQKLLYDYSNRMLLSEKKIEELANQYVVVVKDNQELKEQCKGLIKKTNEQAQLILSLEEDKQKLEEAVTLREIQITLHEQQIGAMNKEKEVKEAEIANKNKKLEEKDKLLDAKNQEIEEKSKLLDDKRKVDEEAKEQAQNGSFIMGAASALLATWIMTKFNKA